MKPTAASAGEGSRGTPEGGVPVLSLGQKGSVRRATVRQINSHTFAGTGYCYVDLPDGRRLRISRARTRKGVVEGRIILGSEKDWEVIPADAEVELS